MHCAHFRAGLNGLIDRLGRSEQSRISEAHGYLHELRTAHSPRVYELIVRASDWMNRTTAGQSAASALLQRLRSADSVSTQLVRNGIDLARMRNLCEPSADVAERRRTFPTAVRDVIGQLDVVHRIAVHRVEKLIREERG